MNAYDDPLYRELIPVRLSRPVNPGDGPTACWLELEREKWAAVHEASLFDEEAEEGAA